MRLLPSSVEVLNAMARIGSQRCRQGIRYGSRQRHVLDVYCPAARHRSATFVFFYGGGWEEGERGDYLFVGAALAACGLTTVIPDYRLFPEARFPDFIEDAAEVLRWTVNCIAQFGGDHRRLVVMGHSAGAYIAAMLAFDRRWLGRVGLVARRDLCAMIGLAGPYDFLPLRSTKLKAIFGSAPDLLSTQPINFVASDAPPAFLAAARRDTVVDPGNTCRMAQRIKAAGGKAEVRLYERVDHRTLVGAYARPLRFLAPVLEDTVGFVEGLNGAGGMT